MQIKVTMKYYFTVTRMAINKKTDTNKCWWGRGGVMPHHTHTHSLLSRQILTSVGEDVAV